MYVLHQSNSMWSPGLLHFCYITSRCTYGHKLSPYWGRSWLTKLTKLPTMSEPRWTECKYDPFQLIHSLCTQHVMSDNTSSTSILLLARGGMPGFTCTQLLRYMWFNTTELTESMKHLLSSDKSWRLRHFVFKNNHFFLVSCCNTSSYFVKMDLLLQNCDFNKNEDTGVRLKHTSRT